MDFTLCLTHACNLRCEYCYAGAKSARRMPWNVAQRAVDFCLDHTVKHAKLLGRDPEAQLGYFGGEPLLEWPMLQRSTEYATAEAERMHIKLRKTVTSNMSLLDEDKSNWLRERGFHLGLSLDGNAAMHNTLRRFADGSASHAACAAALRFFRGPDAGCEVIVVVDPRNVAHLAESVEWLIAKDIRNISLNPNFYIPWSKSKLQAWRQAYEKVGDLFLSCYRKMAPVRINFIDGKIKVRVKDGYEPCDRCGFGENEIAIAASGNIYPCERIVSDDTNKELRIGNVFDGFDREKRQCILSCRGNTLVECADCKIRERCMNWCSCINYATTGAINKVDGIVCFHERMTIEIADRIGAALYVESNPSFIAKFYR
jgi:uncharacterized protein